MTDDLRTRIAQTLEECRTLAPEAQAAAVLSVVQPEIDHARDYIRGRCRACGGTDPHRPWPGQRPRPHAMHCRLYVGPLKHEPNGGNFNAIGNWRIRCTCGQYRGEDDEGCPDAAIDWRGPRSLETEPECAP